MKVVILDAYTANPGDLSWEPFEALGNFIAYDYTPADRTVERAKDVVRESGMLLDSTVIARPDKKLIERIL